MVTAAVRGHFMLVFQMTALPAVRQNVPAASLSIVLENLLVGHARTYLSRYVALVYVADIIAEQALPSQQLDISTVTKLLRAAIRANIDDTLARGGAVQLTKMVRGNAGLQLLHAAFEACAEFGKDSLATGITSSFVRGP
jgi:hypothetical protein